MRPKLLKIAALALIMPLFSMQSPIEWQPLLDKDLSQFETYLSYAHSEDYSGEIPRDQNGNPIPPIGYNKDSKKVFSIVGEPSSPVLRISGETYGAIFTKKAYKNYHLKLQVKWGTAKHTPRKRKLKDSGILYHSNGESGVEHWRSWMLSQEFQVMEGHMGDFWCQANGMVDIRSFQSEGKMNPIADPSAPYVTFQKGGDVFCMRSANHETPNNGWTTLELICFEGKSLHIVNGNVVMILKGSRFRNEKGEAVPMDSGKIQLQSEGAEVFYKDIKIKALTGIPSEFTKLF